jgi:hypothetical protein
MHSAPFLVYLLTDPVSPGTKLFLDDGGLFAGGLPLGLGHDVFGDEAVDLLVELDLAGGVLGGLVGAVGVLCGGEEALLGVFEGACRGGGGRRR